MRVGSEVLPAAGGFADFEAKTRTMTRPLFALAAGAFVLALPVPAQIAPEAGYSRTETLDLGGSPAYGTLSDGGYLSFDGQLFELYAADGTLVSTLGDLGSFSFPSFVAIAPDESFAVAGESSTDRIFRVDLVAQTVTPIASLKFNFDLAFDVDPGTAYVSAALGGFNMGNEIVRLDTATGTTEIVAHVPGPSGPLAIDDAGDLFYVTQYPFWPPPLESAAMIRWTADELAAAHANDQLGLVDSDRVTKKLHGGSSLTHDPHAGRFFLAHVNFQGLSNEILAIDPDGTILDRVATDRRSISNVEVVQGRGEAVFAAYQPTNAALYVSVTDFASVNDRERLEPARAVATFAGPPPGQTGPATVTVEGAEPDAWVSVMATNSAFELPQEIANTLAWGVPAFTAFDLSNKYRRTQPLATDGEGAFTLSFTQTPSIEGEILFQVILMDADGFPIGTSTHVVNE